MEIHSGFTGLKLKPLKSSVQLRDAMNYAAAIDDDNPVYFDDTRPGGVIAHPMYAVSLTWPVIANIFDHIESVDFPGEVLMTMVHYTEHIEFIRPIKPGDDLEIKGVIAAIMPHRAGTHIVLRFEVTDSSGKKVFTEHMGGMLRGVKCIGPSTGEGSLPSIPGIEDAPIIWEKTVRIGSLAAHVYDGCTNIHFPIHTSPKFARSVGLPGIIYQGTATLASAVREIINSETSGDPSRLKAVSCRFSGMVKPGTDILVRGLSSGKKGSCFFDVLNAEGAKAISSGFAMISPEV